MEDKKSKYIHLRVWHVADSIRRHELKTFKSLVWFEGQIDRVRFGSSINLFGNPAYFELSAGHHLTIVAAHCQYFSHERLSDGSETFTILASDAQYLIGALIEYADFQIALTEDDPRVLSFEPTQGSFPDDTPMMPSILNFELVKDEDYED